MKRRRPLDPATLERIRRAAEAQRVAAGLPAEDPGDAPYRELQAQRKRKRAKKAER